MPLDEPTEPTRPRRGKVWLAKVIFQWLVLALVGVGIWRTVAKAWTQIEGDEGFAWSSVRSGWLVAAGLAYLLAMAPSWVFWHRALHAMGQRPRWLESLRAFYIGHLGKYFPGKALVIVLRTGLIRGARVDTTVAAISVFTETLTMMAVGGFVAAAIIAIQFHDRVDMLALALGLMCCSGLPTLPPVFRRLVRLVGARRFNPEIDRSLAGLDYRLMTFGWGLVGPSWFLMGLSLWMTLRAFPAMTANEVTLAAWPLLTACVALAVVAGFASLLPGGIGVRDWVVMELLAPTFGPRAAVVTAVALRLLWLLAELLLAAVLYAIRTEPED